MGSLKSFAFLALLLSLSLAVFADTSNDVTFANDEVKSSKATDVIEPQQRRGCRYGCCGSYAYGRCSACCSRPQAAEVEEEGESKDVVVEPQQRWGSGCRYGCCGGSWYNGRCRYCCNHLQAKAEVVQPQQRHGCRYGCCGSYAYGQCSACCSKKMAMEKEKEKEEAKP